MTTWRERISEARERGAFTKADRTDSMDPSTCAVGESVHALGLDNNTDEVTDIFYSQAPHWGSVFPGHIRDNEFDAAEEALGEIEDRALQLKREQGA